MLDVVMIFALVILFACGFLYIRGCDHLKGARP